MLWDWVILGNGSGTCWPGQIKVESGRNFCTGLPASISQTNKLWQTRAAPWSSWLLLLGSWMFQVAGKLKMGKTVCKDMEPRPEQMHYHAWKCLEAWYKDLASSTGLSFRLTKLLSFGLMPAMAVPPNSTNSNPPVLVFPFPFMLQKQLLAWIGSGPDLAVCRSLEVKNSLLTQAVAKRVHIPKCGPSGARKHLCPLLTFLVSSG